MEQKVSTGDVGFAPDLADEVLYGRRSEAEQTKSSDLP